MFSRNHILLFTPALLILTVLSRPAKAALVKYSYTGNNFTDFSMGNNNYEIPSDYPVTSLSFWFIVDDSLVTKNGRTELYHSVTSAGPDFDSIALIDYHFSNGYQSINYEHLIREWVAASFDTDENGNVTGNWSVAISSFAFFNTMSSVNYETPAGRVVEDYSSSPNHPDHPLLPSHYINSGLTDSKISVSGNPGIWTRSLITVPLPGGFLLFASILGCYIIKKNCLSSGQQAV